MPEDTDPLEINTAKSLIERAVDKRSEYLSSPKFSLEFVFYFDLELHLEVCQNQSKKNDEASTSSRSLSGEGTSVEGVGGVAGEAMKSFKEEISEEPFFPDLVSNTIFEFMPFVYCFQFTTLK